MTDRPEVTFADLVATFMRRRRLMAAVFAVVVSATAAATFATPAEYEATATILVLSERETVVSILRSERYADDVLRAVGGIAGWKAAVTTSAEQVPESAEATLHVTIASGGASTSAAVANAYVDQLATWRPVLRNATIERYWNDALVEAHGNATLAHENLTAMAAGLQYYVPLDAAKPSEAPSAPRWKTNLVIGFGAGAACAILAALVVDAFRGVRLRSP